MLKGFWLDSKLKNDNQTQTSSVATLSFVTVRLGDEHSDCTINM